MEIIRQAKNFRNAYAYLATVLEFGSKSSYLTTWEDCIENGLSIRKKLNSITYVKNGSSIQMESDSSLIPKEEYNSQMVKWEQNNPRSYQAFENWENKNLKKKGVKKMEKFIRMKEAAEILGINPMTVWRLSKENIIPSHETGIREDGKVKRRYLRSELEVYKNQLKERGGK